MVDCKATISIATLIINVLNSSIKMQRLSNYIKKARPIISKKNSQTKGKIDKSIITLGCFTPLSVINRTKR